MICNLHRRLRRALLALPVLALLGACLSTPAPARAAGRARAGSSAAARLARSPAAAAASAKRSKSKGRKKKKKKGPPVLHGDALRALLAFEAMQNAFYIKGSGLYSGEPFSFLWPFSQALAATVSMANIPDTGVSFTKQLHELLAGLHDYLDSDNSSAPEGTFTSELPAFDGTIAPPAGPGGAKYYDDNDWVAIELMRLYQLSHSGALLGSAEGIMEFEMAGWQESPELGCEGGIPFSNEAEDTERNTVTTAPAAELATLLYRATHNVGYLEFAVKAYEWVRTCLLQPGGLYADHVNRRGHAEGALWSYNQGSMIGAGTLLYQATRNGAYLSQARQTAAAALAYFSVERMLTENPFFVSVYFRNLLYLDSLTHGAPGASVAQGYGSYVWTHLRLSDDLFAFSSPPIPELLRQAAVVQIYALLSSPASSYF